MEFRGSAARRVARVLHDQLPRVVVASLVLLAACGGGEGESKDEIASPLAACEGLDSPPPQAATVRAGAGEPLPALQLPCFTGGAPFDLAGLRGPAVVNLWASWCPPCREELPALQRYADAYADEVHVIGVITDDRPEAAAALATDLGITLPGLDDPDRQLLSHVGGALPVTLFVDDAGQVRHVEYGALDEAAVAAYVTEHLVEP